jgi:dTDP-4-dehydrorhamnose 3,5-epimerase
VALTVLQTRLSGPLLLAPDVHGDARGFFAETYRREWLAEHGVTSDFVQDNHSRSAHGVVRAIHFQAPPGCGKLVRCGRGRIWDVVVDLRPGSATFAEWEAHELSDDNMHQLWVPPGFGHGFCVLSEVADVLYKQDRYYSAEVERGIAWDDPDVGIEWPLPASEIVVSERDAQAPALADVRGEL